MNRKSKKAARRLAKLGVSDFETPNAAHRLQADMLRRLERILFDPGWLAGLDDCNEHQCGRQKCSEVCQVGTRRRRLKEIPAVHRLFRKRGGPFCEVRVGRGTWAKPAGQLDRVSIAAAKKLNRWAFDKLYYPGLVAVGLIKVTVAPEYGGGGWKCEIHQVVAGAEKQELERIFAARRYNVGNFLRVKEVKNIGQSINEVLKRDAGVWQHPYQREITAAEPRNAQRGEYYRWLLHLRPNDRIVRYGCDRYFNKLKKKPRVLRSKVAKKRPYPVWLRPYMFGGHEPWCTCGRCRGPLQY